ncbi:MAG: hypothetical protein Q4G24_10195 [Paracoccus sp. (in: a-proteobacteria)]|uniref:hypothetical protein n=1 Tax=Paracoccus sp. TaxID=267 RepID=UPI0026DEA4A6|nr:hypothetical protein [Paracoccus sp. (in: a-proteobacteria)]MDO5621828.1 hypothetical protein [Paracoccus sp. (in: a-proteobacteria)]
MTIHPRTAADALEVGIIRQRGYPLTADDQADFAAFDDPWAYARAEMVRAHQAQHEVQQYHAEAGRQTHANDPTGLDWVPGNGWLAKAGYIAAGITLGLLFFPALTVLFAALELIRSAQ